MKLQHEFNELICDPSHLAAVQRYKGSESESDSNGILSIIIALVMCRRSNYIITGYHQMIHIKIFNVIFVFFLHNILCVEFHDFYAMISISQKALNANIQLRNKMKYTFSFHQTRKRSRYDRLNYDGLSEVEALERQNLNIIAFQLKHRQKLSLTQKLNENLRGNKRMKLKSNTWMSQRPPFINFKGFISSLFFPLQIKNNNNHIHFTFLDPIHIHAPPANHMSRGLKRWDIISENEHKKWNDTNQNQKRNKKLCRKKVKCVRTCATTIIFETSYSTGTHAMFIQSTLEHTQKMP